MRISTGAGAGRFLHQTFASGSSVVEPRDPVESSTSSTSGGGGLWNMMRIYPDRGIGILSMGNVTSYDHEKLAGATSNA